MSSPPTTQPDRTARRLARFEARYGPEVLRLAGYAAFPLALTADVLYHLRQRYVPQAPWYGVGQLVLSGLCEPVGYDLYEMEVETRRALLERLKATLAATGSEADALQKLEELAGFMAGYVQARLTAERSLIARMLGDERQFGWTVLALFNREDDVKQQIHQALAAMAAAGGDPEERFWLARLVRDQAEADWATRSGYRPVLLKWANRCEAGQPVPDMPDPPKSSLGLPVQRFEFEGVTLNGKGEVIRREPQQAFQFQEPLGGGAPPLDMVAIPSGEFLMGAPPEEGDERLQHERPQHKVTVAPFFMGRTPVTQAQWRFVAGLPQIETALSPDPAEFKGALNPVETVNWHEAVEFCARLAQHTGRPYRLPSEAEWEYACRALPSPPAPLPGGEGSQYPPFHFGETITTEIANYNGHESYGAGPKGEVRYTTPVDHFKIANAFGLSDMHGNVWEWCQDVWHENYEGAPTDGSAWMEGGNQERRILRGGSWYNSPRYCRSACRFNYTPGYRDSDLGFRVVCSAPRTLP